METKYLSDGRKVVVIGKLNSQEMIVQEVFVTKSGDEIPSGESFTTKSIHDEPVVSWKQRELEVAVDHIREKAESWIDEGKLREKEYKKCIDMGIEFSQHHEEKYKEQLNKVVEDGISKQKEQIEKAQKKIDELKKSFV